MTILVLNDINVLCRQIPEYIFTVIILQEDRKWALNRLQMCWHLDLTPLILQNCVNLELVLYCLKANKHKILKYFNYS